MHGRHPPVLPAHFLVERDSEVRDCVMRGFRSTLYAVIWVRCALCCACVSWHELRAAMSKTNNTSSQADEGVRHGNMCESLSSTGKGVCCVNTTILPHVQ
mmetsp:Transcript_61177/g.132025  ORF Transcript_61177/g.132025 Transcript_61177/m.132025 type:complete len:100 (-) Transcript_61177:37-336(-)